MRWELAGGAMIGETCLDESSKRD